MATEVRAQETARAAPPAQIQFRPYVEPKPSNLLRSLYVTTATMQVLDVHSTFAALNRGGTEANPMMNGLTKNRVAFGAVKAGVAASSIFAAYKLSKHNKVAAIALLIGINSAYAAVVTHNYRVANQMAR